MKFPQTNGVEVSHGAFAPNGNHLSPNCSANFKITKLLPRFRKDGPQPAADFKKSKVLIVELPSC
jgi:hypothetical protein